MCAIAAGNAYAAPDTLDPSFGDPATPGAISSGVDGGAASVFDFVPAKDFEQSLHFYGTVLGLPAGKRWGDMPGAAFQAGNLTLAVMDRTAFGQEFKPHGLPIALAVDDVAAARESLEAALDLHHRYAPNPA